MHDDSTSRSTCRVRRIVLRALWFAHLCDIDMWPKPGSGKSAWTCGAVRWRGSRFTRMCISIPRIDRLAITMICLDLCCKTTSEANTCQSVHKECEWATQIKKNEEKLNFIVRRSRSRLTLHFGASSRCCLECASINAKDVHSPALTPRAATIAHSTGKQ